MQQRHDEQRPKRAVTSGKQENIQQDFLEVSRAGDNTITSFDSKWVVFGGLLLASTFSTVTSDFYKIFH
jgi:hypothetical protein